MISMIKLHFVPDKYMNYLLWNVLRFFILSLNNVSRVNPFTQNKHWMDKLP